jgi:hypothetical protein
MQMIMGSNKRWSDLTARQKAPLVVQEIVQRTLLVAALTDIHRRPTEEIKGSKWVWSVAAFATSWASVRSPTSPSGGSMPNDSPSERRTS